MPIQLRRACRGGSSCSQCSASVSLIRKSLAILSLLMEASSYSFVSGRIRSSAKDGRCPIPFLTIDRLVAKSRRESAAAPVLEEFGFLHWPSESLPWLVGISYGSGTVERWHPEAPYNERVSRCLRRNRRGGLPLQVSLLLFRRRAGNR